MTDELDAAFTLEAGGTAVCGQEVDKGTTLSVSVAMDTLTTNVTISMQCASQAPVVVKWCASMVNSSCSAVFEADCGVEALTVSAEKDYTDCGLSAHSSCSLNVIGESP